MIMNTKNDVKRVFVVLSDSTGVVTVAGVYSTLEAAESHVWGPDGNDCYIDDPNGEAIRDSARTWAVAFQD
jgi:hypothetical protein